MTLLSQGFPGGLYGLLVLIILILLIVFLARRV